ncbi:MAG: hypothetical protein ABPD24_00785 [Candidatus Shikimatogenerans sp. AspAUS03]|uniref:Ribosomal protein S19 n=1 Tax=Candidatus Shikimatogenerans sp. AspAUS03 TaxID=3158563 RepID=A0AAU7QS95_9FLAO
MNIINKYLLIYYFYNIKNNLFNKIIFVVKNEIPKDTNIILSPQIYLNILKKKKIIINELSGYILIDYQYSIYLKKKIKKKINKL